MNTYSFLGVDRKSYYFCLLESYLMFTHFLASILQIKTFKSYVNLRPSYMIDEKQK